MIAGAGIPADARDVAVRVAGEADAAAIASLRARSAGGAEHDPAFGRRMGAWLAAEAGRRTTWLAVAGTQPVGMVSSVEFRRMPKPGRADACWGYVATFYVRDEVRGRGVGSALLAAVTRAADERGYARLVVSPSAAASGMFRRAGFVVPGEAEEAPTLLVRPGRRGS